MNDDEFNIWIPPRFWETITVKEMREIYERNGDLDAEQSARVWRMTERQSPAPERIQTRLKISPEILAWLRRKYGG